MRMSSSTARDADAAIVVITSLDGCTVSPTTTALPAAEVIEKASRGSFKTVSDLLPVR